jgi:VanZ family protein
VSALRFLPPLAWTALIAWLSSPGWSASATGTRLFPLLRWLLPWAAPEQLEAFHWAIRKSAHLVEYGVLALLWTRALGSGDARRAGRLSIGLCVLTAALDELHQATTSTRGGSVLDVLLDSAGAAAVVTAFRRNLRDALGWLTGALLWAGAAGGTAFILIDWTSGAPAGWLWWSVPASWVALVLWWRGARS